MAESEATDRKEHEMVWEIILLTIIGEAVTIYGLAAWFKYTDMINNLKGED